MTTPSPRRPVGWPEVAVFIALLVFLFGLVWLFVAD